MPHGLVWHTLIGIAGSDLHPACRCAAVPVGDVDGHHGRLKPPVGGCEARARTLVAWQSEV